MYARLVLVVLACALLAAPARAGADPWINANLLVTEADFQSGCSGFAEIDAMACGALVNAPTSGPAFVWVVVSPSGGFGGETNDVPEGLTAAQLGIAHDLENLVWISCADLEISSPTWPASGSGTAIAWNECYTPSGPSARLGFFYLPEASAGTMQLTNDPRDGRFAITDCRALTYQVCADNVGSLDLAVGSTPTCTDDAVFSPPTNVHVETDVDACTALVTWEHDGHSLHDFVVRLANTFVVVDASARSLVDTTIDHGGRRYYQVTARSECLDRREASELLTVDLPVTATPSSCVATDDLCERVVVTWQDNSDDEAGFRIERAGPDGFPSFDVGADVTTFTDSTVVAGRSYVYQVHAISHCGGAETDRAFDYGRPSSTPDTPTSLVASTGLCSFVELSWQDASDNESGFHILRDGVPIASVEAGVEVYLDSTAVPDVTYDYGVQAFNACYASETPTVAGTAGGAPPTPPADLVASDDLCLRIRLEWTDTSPDETGFQILRDDALLVEVPANVTAFEDSTTDVDAPHTYTVRASSPCGSSAPSAPAEGVRVEETAPTSSVVLAAPASDAECLASPVTFRWRRDPNASLYELQVLASCDGAPLQQVSVADTVALLSPPPGPVYWRVRARNACGVFGPFSTCRTLSIDPRPLAPPVPSFLQVAPTDWNIAWYRVPGAEYYEIATGAATCPELDAGTTIYTVTGPDTTLALGAYGWTAWVTAVACGVRGTPSECFSPGSPTPVLLDYFRASPDGGRVAITWRTRTEAGISAFNVYREQSGVRVRVNPIPLPAGAGTYAITDDRATPGTIATYVLTELLDDDGEIELARADVVPAPIPSRLVVSARPNPFNPRVTISIGLPAAGGTRLDVLDVTGRRVRRLVDGPLPAGAHEIVWDGTDGTGRSVASGVYYARLSQGTRHEVRRLVLLR